MKFRGVLKKLKIKKKSSPDGIEANETAPGSFAFGIGEAEAETSGPGTPEVIGSAARSSSVPGTMDFDRSTMERTRSQQQPSILRRPSSTTNGDEDGHADQADRTRSDLRRLPIAVSRRSAAPHHPSNGASSPGGKSPMRRSRSSPKIGNSNNNNNNENKSKNKNKNKNNHDEIVCCEEFREDFRTVKEGFLPDDGSWASFGHGDFFAANTTQHSTVTAATTLASSSGDFSNASGGAAGFANGGGEKSSDDRPSPSSGQESPPPATGNIQRRTSSPSPPTLIRRSCTDGIHLSPPDYSFVEASSEPDDEEEEETRIRLSALAELRGDDRSDGAAANDENSALAGDGGGYPGGVPKRAATARRTTLAPGNPGSAPPTVGDDDEEEEEEAATSAGTPPPPGSDPAFDPPALWFSPNPFATSATTVSALSASVAQSSKATTISGGSVGGNESDASTTFIGELSFDASSGGSYPDVSRSHDDDDARSRSAHSLDQTHTSGLDGISTLSEDFTDFAPEYAKSRGFSQAFQSVLFGIADYVCPMVVHGEDYSVYDA